MEHKNMRESMEKLLTKLEFTEVSSHYWKAQAKGKLAYWTDITVDMRWYNRDVEVYIFGVRGSESDYLFRGNILDEDQLKQILKWTNAI